jgi:hypothetical protein
MLRILDFLKNVYLALVVAGILHYDRTYPEILNHFCHSLIDNCRTIERAKRDQRRKHQGSIKMVEGTETK